MAKRIILATVYNTAASGGLSTFVKLYAEGLRKRGVTVSIIDENDMPALQRFISYKLIRNALYVLNKDWGMRWYFAAAASMMGKTVGKKMSKGTIIHAQDPVALCGIITHIKGDPATILNVHGDLANMCRSDNVVTAGGKAEREALAIEKRAYTEADAVVAVDTRLHDHVQSFIKRDVDIIKNFVDPDAFIPPKANERDTLRQRLCISGFAVFCPRRLVPKNGVIFAAEAISIMKDANITLLFAGDGAERRRIQAIIDQHSLQGRIIMLGDIPHNRIIEYYKACDAVLIPSVTSEGVIEATSISALEGMACERIVIASDIGGLAELIKNGKTGILVPEQHPKRIADAIRKAKLPAAKRLGVAARKFIIMNNSVQSQTKRYFTICSRVAKKKRLWR
jgi:glycosyltransferase involved in cell wall biosynthesis